jgi:hypothetical protein
MPLIKCPTFDRWGALREVFGVESFVIQKGGNQTEQAILVPSFKNARLGLLVRVLILKRLVWHSDYTAKMVQG